MVMSAPALTASGTPRDPILRAALLGIAIAGGTIAAAWAFELIGGLAPCPLCLTQRIPYYAGLPVAGLAAFFALRPGGLALGRLTLLVFAAIMLASAGLGAYHAGVEWHWWPGPADCAVAADAAATSITALQQQLANAPRLVPCDEAAWRFLGLSLAGWNVVISLGVAVLSLAAIKASLSTRT